MSARTMGLACVLALLSAAAHAEILVDHSAGRGGGGGISDSAVPPNTPYGGAGRIADDFRSDAEATIRHVTWWGYYWHDVLPTAETMRLRIYDARAGDGLPGSPLFEENLVNPARSATGAIVQGIPAGTSGTALEFVYESDLPQPVPLDAGRPYWLEIMQEGDSSTAFFWNGALADQNGVAYLRAGAPDWQQIPFWDSAFQLSTVPETTTLGLLAVGLMVLPKTRQPLRNRTVR